MKFEIKENIALLSDSENGYIKEVNVVSWNGGPDRIDIRTWEAGNDETGKQDIHLKPRKGVTLTKQEARVLRDALNNMKLDDLYG